MLFTMTIDTEEEWDWGACWPTTDLSVSNVKELPRFQELCDRYGVATTYFANQAVLDDREARETLLSMARESRVEIGMHIHPWNTPPLDTSGPVTPRSTFLHNLPRDQVQAKLSSVYDRFKRYGLAPTSFRGGRYSSGGPIHEFLREHGFLADASVVPFTTWLDEGAPQYRARGLEPARLSPRFEGDRPFWEIPLTLGFTRTPFSLWAKWYHLVEACWLRKLRLIGLGEKIGLVCKVWLNFEGSMGARMLPFLHRLRKTQLPCICFTVHSSSLVAGKGPYTRSQADQDRLFAQLEEVFGTLSRWPEFQPATVTEVAKHLEESYHARTRN